MEGSRAPAQGSEAALEHADPAGGGTPAGRPTAAGPAAGVEQGGIISEGGIITEGGTMPSQLLDLQTEGQAAASPQQGQQASLLLDLQTEPPHVAAASGQDDQQDQRGPQLSMLQTQVPAGSSQGGLQASLRLDLQTEEVSGQDHQQGSLPPNVHMEGPDAQPAGSG